MNGTTITGGDGGRPGGRNTVEKLEDLGEQIAEVAGRITAAEHRLLTLVREFDERKGWAQQGAKTCADWLSFKIGLDPVTAREKVRVARALGRLPLVDEAYRKGQLSYSKIRAITRVANEKNEELLVRWSLIGTGAMLERICRTYRRIVEPKADGTMPKEDSSRYVSSTSTGWGFVRIEAHLPSDEAAIVLKALDSIRFAGNEELWRRQREQERTKTGNSAAGDVNQANQPSADTCCAQGAMLPETTIQDDSASDGSFYGPDLASLEAAADARRRADAEEARRRRLDRADALVALAHSALDAGVIAHPSSPRFEVVMNVDAASLRGESETLATLDGGVGIPPEIARRVACDAAKVEVVVDDKGDVLDVGRRTRTIPPSIRRALRSRDKQCRFPSCQHDRFVDGHHIVHWADGGDTKLDNLVLLCRHHHRLVHEEGFSVVMTAEGPVFRTPKGKEIPAVASLPEIPGDELSWEGFLAWQGTQGIGVEHEGYSHPDYWGWDFGLTIDVLLQRSGELH